MRFHSGGGRPGRRQFFILAAGLLMTLAMAAVFLWQPPFLAFLGHKTYDSLLRAVGQAPPSPDLVILDVDEASVARQGQWPWPRHRVARLLDKVMDLGARMVAVDFLFSEPDSTSLATIREEMSREMGLDIPATPTDSYWPDNDCVLASALARGRFVLGMKFLYNNEKITHQEDCVLHPLRIAVTHSRNEPPPSSPWFIASGVACNLPVLSASVERAGFMDVSLDSDGVLRRVPLVIEYQSKLYPSLALAAYLEARGLSQVVVHLSAMGTEALQVRENLIPVDAKAQLLVNYRGPAGTFPFISANDVLEDRVPAGALKDRIVLVGTSAAGLKDLRATPLGSATSGVEIHANVLDNLLRGDYITSPPYAPGLTLFLVLACGLASTLFLAFFSSLGSLAASLLGVALVLAASAWSIEEAGIYWSPLWPVLTLVMNLLFLGLARFWWEEQLVKKRSQELLTTQQATIIALASLSETRDNETGAHIKRTQLYVKTLARHLKSDPKYRWDLDGEFIEQLVNCAPLHDVGKVGVPDSVLLKPGPLNPEEFEEMKKHTTYGMAALKSAERDMGDNSFLRMACQIAHTHHERWDGAGYPQGLAGRAIPLAGRLMALADVYDALTSRRIYKPAFSHQKAVAIIREGRGTQFDPYIVDAFLEIQEEFRAIAAELADTPEEDPS